MPEPQQRTCHCHSAAIASARARVGTASACLAGVRNARLSRNTWKRPCTHVLKRLCQETRPGLS